MTCAPRNSTMKPLSNMFEFIYENKRDLITALKDWEATGTQAYFDPIQFKQYLLFISKWSTLSTTMRQRLFNPSSKCLRLVLNNKEEPVRGIEINKVDGVNYHFASGLTTGCKGADFANYGKKRIWIYSYDGVEKDSIVDMTYHISSNYPQFSVPTRVYYTIKSLNEEKKYKAIYKDLLVTKRRKQEHEIKKKRKLPARSETCSIT